MKKLEEIDYTPLNAMKGAFGAAVKNIYHLWWGRLMYLAACLLPILSLLTRNFGWLFFGASALLIPLAIYTQKYKDQIWEQFAAINGWQVSDPPVEAEVPPSVQFGNDRELGPVVNAQFNDLSVDLFVYNCTTGSGKSAVTHFFTIARVLMPEDLPHMMLDSKAAHTDIRDEIWKSTKLQLEGNFSDYFTLKIESGEQIDALTIITPDVMQTLLTYNQKEDIEIYQKYLYFIVNNDKREADDVRRLLGSVDALTKQIIENLNIPLYQVAA